MSLDNHPARIGKLQTVSDRTPKHGLRSFTYTEATMFGIAAVVVFALAYLLNGFHVGNAWLGGHPLTYLGLTLLALHLLPSGPRLPWRA